MDMKGKEQPHSSGPALGDAHPTSVCINLRQQRQMGGSVQSSSWRPASHLCACLNADGGVCAISQRVHPDSQRALGCEHPADLALELGGALADERRVVDQAILWCLVLGLEGPAGEGAEW
jgi:hypothetical protein